MKAWISAGAAGALFALGLFLGGMARPEKVLAFLDIAGTWDPSLVFVLVSAVAVHGVGRRLASLRERPLFAPGFFRPDRTRVDAALVAGSVLFGVGWGLTGLCPGPALFAGAGGVTQALVFLPGMIAGVVLHDRVWTRRLCRVPDPVGTSSSARNPSAR